MRDELVSTLYFLTVNSNINNNEQNAERIQNFINLTKRQFLSSKIVNYLEIQDPKDVNTPKEKLIYSIDITLNFEEMKSAKKSVHYHAIIRIVHRTTVYFDINKKFRKEISKSMRSNPNIQIVNKPDKMIGLTRYIAKGNINKDMNVHSTMTFLDKKTRTYNRQF